MLKYVVDLGLIFQLKILLFPFVLAIKYDIPNEDIPNPRYKCTHHNCPWSEYQKDVHWGFYIEMGANITGCELCMTKCDHNMSCGSVECGEDQPLLDGTVVKAHCSWWRKGSCETAEEFTTNPADFIWTCKKKGNYTFA